MGSVAVIVVFAQAILGGCIRHLPNLTVGRLHLLGAFAAFGCVFFAVKTARETDRAAFRWPCRILETLLTLQILLGVEVWMAWMKRFFYPNEAGLESTATQMLRSSHYLVGSLVFAATVVLTVKAFATSRAEATA